MNNDKLERLLKSVPVPPREADYWEDFPRDVVRRLRSPTEAPSTRPPNRRPRVVWLFAAATASAILALALILKPASRPTPQFLLNEAVVGELLAMFPNRVRAILQDGQGMRLVLSDEPDVPSSTPLWVRICRGTQCLSAVTFSGQEVPLDGQSAMVLADARGGVILVGDRFAWTSQAPSRGAGGLRIQAAPLSQVATR
jgi:hypothetical protein